MRAITPAGLLALHVLPSLALGQVFEVQEWENQSTPTWNGFNASLCSAPAGQLTFPCVNDSGPASPAGGRTLRFTYAAGMYSTSFSAGRAEFNFSPRPIDLYIGAWIRYSSPFDFNPSNQKIFWCGMNQNETPTNFGNNLVTTWNGAGATISGITQLVWGAGSANHYPNVTNYAAADHVGQWVWLEQRCKLNTPGMSDGVYSLWINDMAIAHYTDVPVNEAGTSPTLGWYYLSITAEWGGGGGTINQLQHWDVDHVVLSTQRIGMPGGMQDTTAPAAPTSLAVS
jgi:hypothetical protein